jgi:hypothetical protein
MSRSVSDSARVAIDAMCTPIGGSPALAATGHTDTPHVGGPDNRDPAAARLRAGAGKIGSDVRLPAQRRDASARLEQTIRRAGARRSR